jgi:hypothetical protein
MTKSAPEGQTDSLRLLATLLEPCEGADEHSWRKCKRCTAMHGLEMRFPVTMRLMANLQTLAAENLRLRAQLTEQAQQIRALEKLTQDDWDEIKDGLEAAEMHAREQAAMWAGRSRAAQYVREADRTLATHNKVKDLLAALQTDPRQP